MKRSVLVVALAIVAGGLVAPEAAAAAGTYSFAKGILQPNQVKTFVWDNVGHDAYAPGVEAKPVDDPALACNISVYDQYYSRLPNGNRRLHLTLSNVAYQRCDVKIWLRGLDSFRTSSIATLAPGGSRTLRWNNAHAERYIYVVGVEPEQVSGGTCAMKVESNYRRNPDGESEFFYTTTNIGTVSCAATLQHVRVPVQVRYDLGTYVAGGGEYVRPELVDIAPPARVVVAGVLPGRSDEGACKYEIWPMRYESQLNVRAVYYNSGSVDCELSPTFAKLV